MFVDAGSRRRVVIIIFSDLVWYPSSISTREILFDYQAGGLLAALQTLDPRLLDWFI